MKNILMLNKIAKVGTDRLDPAVYALGTEVQNPDGILVRSAVMHDMPLGDNLLATINQDFLQLMYVLQHFHQQKYEQVYL